MRNRKIILIIAVGLTTLIVALIYPLPRPPVMNIEALRENGVYLYDEPLQVTDFSLVDHNGAAFTRDVFQDKWSLVFFGYTYCPDICPITLASLKRFYDLLTAEGLAETVQVVMVSVDPRRDTPQVLARYVEFFNPDFIGVTGDYARIYAFARRMNVAFSYQQLDGEDYLVNHNGEIMLINPAAGYHGFFKAPHEPARMLENFRSVTARWD